VEIAIAVVLAALSGGGILVWLGLLLWAAREDGRRQREAERESARARTGDHDGA
jgi:hypothetical protein